MTSNLPPNEKAFISMLAKPTPSKDIVECIYGKCNESTHKNIRNIAYRLRRKGFKIKSMRGKDCQFVYWIEQ